MKSPLLLPVLLLLAAPAAAEGQLGCTPVNAARVSAEQLAADLKPKLQGAGVEVPYLADNPGVSWDLGDKRAVELNVYLTRYCQLGMQVLVKPGHPYSTPDLQGAVDDLGRRLQKTAPDWTFAVEPPSTIKLHKAETAYSTSVPALLKARLDGATQAKLAGAPVRLIFTRWTLFIVPENAEKAVLLSVRSTVHPWAYYDLTQWGLPRVLARFSDDKAVVWTLP